MLINEQIIIDTLNGKIEINPVKTSAIHDEMCEGRYINYLEDMVFSNIEEVSKSGLYILSEIDPNIDLRIQKIIKTCLSDNDPFVHDYALKSIYDHFFYKDDYIDNVFNLLLSDYYTARENSFNYLCETSLIFTEQFNNIFENFENTSKYIDIQISNAIAELKPMVMKDDFFKQVDNWLYQSIFIVKMISEGKLSKQWVNKASKSHFEIIRDWSSKSPLSKFNSHM